MYSDNVDYESIYNRSEATNFTFAIEFVGIPREKFQVFNSLLEWSFDLPVHLRYQKPAHKTNDSYASVVMQAPSMYVRVHRRKQTCSSKDGDVFSETMESSPLQGSQRRLKRYYDVTFLGNKGNSDSVWTDLPLVSPYFDSAAVYEKPQVLLHEDKSVGAYFTSYSDQIILSMPLGNTEDLPFVFISTMGVTLLTTLGLILLMVRKAMIGSR